MTEQAWLKGMAELAASFPDRDEAPEVKAIRGQVYRRELARLTDETWLYAVRSAIQSEKWFPSVAALLDYANDAPEAPVKGLLPADTRTVEEKRADFREGFERFRSLFKEHMADLDQLAASKEMPK
jgi:hypothetical protein